MPQPRRQRQQVGMVLSDGGVRGAYEIGALSVLLPALEADERPRIFVGTSLGAANTAYLAATAHKTPEQSVNDGLDLWRSLRFEQVVSPLLSLTEFARLWSYLGEVAGIPGARIPGSLLDTAPAVATLRERISFKQIHDNVEQGTLAAAGVVTTSSSTNLSVVFHDGGGKPPQDRRCGIDYVQTQLTEDHVHASTAFPVIFPAIPLSPNGEER